MTEQRTRAAVVRKGTKEERTAAFPAATWKPKPPDTNYNRYHKQHKQRGHKYIT
jgi:hypothetical protein